MIKVLIVENEPLVAEALHGLLLGHFSDITVLGVVDSVENALHAIRQSAPDLVFMDIELNHGETSFDILRKLAEIDFKIIFTTSYGQYAIQAIKFSALDFLLKPIDLDELRIAIHKFVRNRTTTSSLQQQALLNYQPGNQQIKIGLPVLEGIQLVEVSDIIYCEGESAQTWVYLTHQQRMLVSRTLKEFDEMLTGFDFCRIHKSYLINLRHMVKYHKGDGGSVTLSDGSHVDVSKTYKEDLLSRLKRI